MEEYTCKKCGEVCEIEWGVNNKPYWPDCYCEACQEDAGGFDKIQNERSAQWLSDRHEEDFHRREYERERAYLESEKEE